MVGVGVPIRQIGREFSVYRTWYVTIDHQNQTQRLSTVIFDKSVVHHTDSRSS